MKTNWFRSSRTSPPCGTGGSTLRRKHAPLWDRRLRRGQKGNWGWSLRRVALAEPRLPCATIKRPDPAKSRVLVVRYTSDTDGHTLATHRSADAGSKRGVGWVGETAPNALHETSRVKGSPRLRQSLAALGSGYGLNEELLGRQTSVPRTAFRVLTYSLLRLGELDFVH
jgi:hypothetical protein